MPKECQKWCSAITGAHQRTTPGAIPDLEQEVRTISPATALEPPPIAPAMTKSSKEEVEVCADGEGDAAGEYVEDDIGKVWELQTPPLQCSAKLPNPRPPSAPTSGNSDTSSADPNGSLINSNAFSAAVDASPEFPWTPEAFPDPRTIHFPTDPIRMSPRPIPRLHPTTVDSVQFRQAAAISSALWSRPVFLCLPKFLLSPMTVRTLRARYDLNIPMTTPDLTPTQPRNTSHLGNLLSNLQLCPHQPQSLRLPRILIARP
ncbi:hypothetical protein E4T56_gene1543 [Termitomyces sp. T112]|nr:hypothetical protein E4T56_gene1543 [Termitomyces sp. T112]